MHKPVKYCYSRVLAVIFSVYQIRFLSNLFPFRSQYVRYCTGLAERGFNCHINDLAKSFSCETYSTGMQHVYEYLYADTRYRIRIQYVKIPLTCSNIYPLRVFLVRLCTGSYTMPRRQYSSYGVYSKLVRFICHIQQFFMLSLRTTHTLLRTMLSWCGQSTAVADISIIENAFFSLLCIIIIL